MKFWKSNGLYYAGAAGNNVTATTLERLLAQLDPGAPPEKLAAAAEILESLIGKTHEQIHHGVIS